VVDYGVALDGNPEPDLLHATGCKQPTLRNLMTWNFEIYYMLYSSVRISSETFT
jgi:hypothetical protein